MKFERSLRRFRGRKRKGEGRLGRSLNRRQKQRISPLTHGSGVSGYTLIQWLRIVARTTLPAVCPQLSPISSQLPRKRSFNTRCQLASFQFANCG
jgi:hypothetical protein